MDDTRSEKRKKNMKLFLSLFTGVLSLCQGFAPVAKSVDSVVKRRAMADLLREAKLDIPWLAEGEAPSKNKENIPASIRDVMKEMGRMPETEERVKRVRGRAAEATIAAVDIQQASKESDDGSWWMQRDRGEMKELRVLVAGGGLAGLACAAACRAKGMRVAVFEQANVYAPYGGPIQIQSNALKALQRLTPDVYHALCDAGTLTADRVSGLKIGYRRGNKLAGIYDAGDWLVRFDTVRPALEAGLPPTLVVDRPVIQQILLNHGHLVNDDENSVRIASRVKSYKEMDDCVMATLEDGTVAYGDILIGADGIWSTVRHQLHGLDDSATASAATGAAGGALDDQEAAKLNKNTVRMAQMAKRRYSGFTCYAGLCAHNASNIEDVSYQILLGSSKYFVSTDAGGARQQWFALIREPPGGVDQPPSDSNNYIPKLNRLRHEFSHHIPGDADGNVWDPFALELVNATHEADIKRRDLYDGHPLVRDPTHWLRPWASDRVCLAGDAAHPMMPNLGQGGCQSVEDAARLVDELYSTVKDPTNKNQIADALGKYSRARVLRTGAVQGLAQLGSDLLVDFDLMMTIPIIGPAFLAATQLSMPWILRFLYVPPP